MRDSQSGSVGLAVFPPIGLEYIAASLRPHVEQLTFLDLRLHGPLRDLDKLKRFIADEIDLLCISINWEYHFDEVCKLINTLPGDVTTVVGGKQATDSLDEVFEACPAVDIMVRGEGEETIAELASGVRLEDILGISYRRNGEIVHNPNRPLREVDTYPYPDRSLRQRNYHLSLGGFALGGVEFDSILTSRGCPYNCKFCTFNLNPWTQKRRFSARSVESVIAELKQISAGMVLIADENFFVVPSRAKEICQRIIAEGLNKRFLVQARIEIFEHPEVLDAAAQAGIKVILLGIESPTDRILDQLHKGFDTAKVRRAFEVFRNYPFYYHGYFIYGNLTETEAEMMQIPVFAKELGLDSIAYQKLRIEKYSPLKEETENTSGYYVGDDHIVYQEGLGRPYLKRISRQITKEFYTPGQLWKLLRKVFAVGFFLPRDFPVLVLSFPIVAGMKVSRKVRKKLNRLSLWRRFFPHSP